LRPTSQIVFYARAGDVRWCALDGLFAVHHLASGQSHIVAPVARAIFDLVASRPMSAPRIAAALARDYDLVADGDADIAGTLAERIAELDRLGLIRPVLPSPA